MPSASEKYGLDCSSLMVCRISYIFFHSDSVGGNIRISLFPPVSNLDELL